MIEEDGFAKYKRDGLQPQHVRSSRTVHALALSSAMSHRGPKKSCQVPRKRHVSSSGKPVSKAHSETIPLTFRIAFDVKPGVDQSDRVRCD